MGKWLRIVIILSLAPILVLPILGISCNTGSLSVGENPEKTVKTFYDACENLDADKVTDLWIKEQRTNAGLWFGACFAATKSFSISDLRVTVVSQTVDTAEIAAEYHYRITLKGEESVVEHEVDHFELRRIDNRWLIKDSDCGVFGID
jgi:hypothetical protein